MKTNFKIFVAFVCVASISSVVFAGGRKGVDEKSLGAENSWQEQFDINEKKPGKYNVMVTAEDKAGNTAVEGPFNIWIDPESDLPVISITNPAENMRVPGNLNIVGTCVDDDAVESVSIILDGNEDDIKNAEGKDFWSYYIDTNDMLEGPHTIEVFGTDINGLSGHHAKVMWQLDRRAPVTTVLNYGMGELVSGKIKLEGRVTDGNGIRGLQYSLDGGLHYKEAKLKENKFKEPDEEGHTSEWLFSVPVDTTKFADGSATCWFKATDNMGSVGRFAFLYFIDNTKPDVKIVLPEENEVKNGIFTVAGYAKDTIGIESLSWQWGTESGDFNLIPGNSYWVKEVNATGKVKNETFSVTAVDTMGNTVTVKRVIPINNENDKPVVKITAPENKFEFESSSVYFRGIATDDDGVVSVHYSVDGGDDHEIKTAGVFSTEIEGDFSYGNHTITAYAIDKYGVKGNTASTTFFSRGLLPVFENAQVHSGKNTVAFTDGMEIIPESDSLYTVKVNSESGLNALEYEIHWGTNGIITGQAEFTPGSKSANLSIPLFGENFPWGVSTLTVKATDIYNRTKVQNSLLYVRNLTKMNSVELGIYFDDSTISSQGGVLYEEGTILTGYFLGGQISSVSITPAIKGLSVTNEGNVIVVRPSGVTDKFHVSVTAANGKTFSSREMYFYANEKAPVIALDSNNSYDTENGRAFEFQTTSDELKISGTVTAESAVTLKYRVLSVEAKLPLSAGGYLTSSSVLPAGEFADVSVSRRGAFSITNLKFDSFPDGVSVVELVATSASGKQSNEAVVVRKIPYAPTTEILGPDGKALSKAVPAVYWLKGAAYYGVCVYQGPVDKTFIRVRQEDIRLDQNTLTFTVTPQDVDPNKQGKVPSYSAEPLPVNVKSVIEPRIVKVDGIEYKSGMQIVLNRGATAEEGHNVTVSIKSNSPVASVSYTFSGEDIPSGDVTQTGTANIRVIEEGSLCEADIPLANLPARVTKISVTAKDTTGNTNTVHGTIVILRNHSVVDDATRVYWMPLEGVSYNESLHAYVMKKGSSLYGFGNFRAPLEASVTNSGLTASAAGHGIKLTGMEEGYYRNVLVRISAGDGGTYNAPEVNLYVDGTGPAIDLQSPLQMAWVKESFNLSGTVTDVNGVAKLEYSLDEAHASYLPDSEKKKKPEEQQIVPQTELTWLPVTLGKSGNFSQNISLAEAEDGYIPFTLRATDYVGNETYIHGSLFRDTTPPEVKVILPDEGAVVNGENTLVFSVKDNGAMNEIVYLEPNKRESETFRVYNTHEEVEALNAEEQYNLITMNNALPNLLIGGTKHTLDNGMQFTFTDAIGNSTVIKEWAFSVDDESDKPRPEIHLPEDNQVITTDFTISGIIYDDDGPSHLYYKIDNGSYRKVSEEMASSYKINVPLNAMTDNEHTVTVYATDINGVKGDEVTGHFRISLEEPKGAVTEPEISKTIKDSVTLRGWATDKNGISRVQISIDNGASYNEAELVRGGDKERVEWNYTFDTHVVQDGTHVVFLKIWDGYEITGLFSSLINIDNTPPDLHLELPLDDSRTSRALFFAGQTTDNIGLTQLYITIRSLENRSVPERLAHRDLVPDEIIAQALDISELNNGFYNIELTGVDAAGNISRVSRNIQLDKTRPLVTADLLYPLNGEHLQGEFNVYGTASSEKEDPIERVDFFLDGKKLNVMESAKVSPAGYFMFHIAPTMKKAEKRIEEDDGTTTVIPEEVFELTEGRHTYQVIATTKAGKSVTSNEQNFVYTPYGPWVTLDNFAYGDFAVNRPLIKGVAGYTVSQEDKDLLRAKDTPSEERERVEGMRVKQVSLSLDNGKTYEPVAKLEKGEWQYRVENLDIPAGYHFLLVRAEMMNGEVAITRTIVQVDRTLPSIKLISPGVGGRYNQKLEFDGLSSDDIDLSDVKIILRQGDKANYEVPAGLQGLYFDVSFWGATLYNLGVGVTAFDGAVKIQGNFGQFTQNQRDFVSDLLGQPHTNYRFGGNVIGGKIIAQIFYLPFRYFWGRDWDWLSATAAVGANFSYFSESGASITTGKPVPQVLSAAFAQVEFPRMTFSQNKLFTTWAFYYEPQVWFIPSDIASDDVSKYVFTWSAGIRTNLF